MTALDQLLLKAYREKVSDLGSRDNAPELPGDDADAHEMGSSATTPATAEESQKHDTPLCPAATETHVDQIAALPLSDQPCTESIIVLGEYVVDFADEGTPANTAFDAPSSDSEDLLADSHEAIESVPPTLDDTSSEDQPPIEGQATAEVQRLLNFAGETPDSQQVEAPAAIASEQDPEIPAELLVAFKPEWDVDNFHWPGLCLRLSERLGAELDDAVAQLQQECQAGRNVMLLTSPQRRSGRTTLTLCLARCAAQRGMRVAVVDLDFENPQLMTDLGVSAEIGLESVRDGTATAENICIAALEDGVSLFPTLASGDKTPWSWQDLAAALKHVAAHHDVVLLDSPPCEQLDSMFQNESPPIELGAIIVQDARASQAEDVQALATRLRAKHIWMAGIVENFAA